MKIPFTKMHGLGNDFVIIESDANSVSINKKLIKKICSRNYGVGCDQLLLINSYCKEEVDLTIFNNDGSEVGACGNGVRCVASMIMEKNNVNQIYVKTITDKLKCWKNGNSISVNMGKPRFKWNQIPLSKNINPNELMIDGYKIHCVSFGNPHGVIFFKNKSEFENVNIRAIGPKLEKNLIFKEGANIEFATILDDGKIKMRVWERDVGITLACGSGACATLVLASVNNLSPRKNSIYLDGGVLDINWNNDDHVIMTGEIEKVFEGHFNG